MLWKHKPKAINVSVAVNGLMINAPKNFLYFHIDLCLFLKVELKKKLVMDLCKKCKIPVIIPANKQFCCHGN